MCVVFVVCVYISIMIWVRLVSVVVVSISMCTHSFFISQSIIFDGLAKNQSNKTLFNLVMSLTLFPSAPAFLI